MAGVCPSGSLRDDIPSTSTFTLFVGTWNVNGQSPEGGLDNWLEVHMEAPDLYVLGFQELDLSWWAYLFQESVKEDEWIKAVKESLPAKASYLMVKKDASSLLQRRPCGCSPSSVSGQCGNRDSRDFPQMGK